MIEVFRKFNEMLAARRRRRALVKIRQEFARSGHPLDGHADSVIEASLPPGVCETPPDYLGAKTISRALRRLSNGPAGEHRHALREARAMSVTGGIEVQPGVDATATRGQ
ncbi:MAG TPA: hypothetical protein VFX96_01150 [Pyrinomonadaceae bacterium]|nr:hypothetical protein [Pyrinomonadaceae bacterium]